MSFICSYLERLKNTTGGTMFKIFAWHWKSDERVLFNALHLLCMNLKNMFFFLIRFCEIDLLVTCVTKQNLRWSYIKLI